LTAVRGIWRRSLTKMQDDSFYYGNLSKNALSSTACKMLLTSPKTYHYVTKYGSEDSDAFAVGRLVHLMALEPHKVEEYEVIEVQSKNAKAWQEAKGKRNICTRKEYNEAQRIADALLRNENVLGLITGCEFEVPKIGMIGGLPFRAKADIYADGFLADLKSTQPTYVHSLIQLSRYGYDVQAFIYTRLFGVPIDKFFFIAIDKAKP
jgi:hypothetical protein